MALRNQALALGEKAADFTFRKCPSDKLRLFCHKNIRHGRASKCANPGQIISILIADKRSLAKPI